VPGGVIPGTAGGTVPGWKIKLGGPIEFKSPIGNMSIEEFLYKIASAIFILSLVVAPLMLVIAGVLFVTSGGNPQQIDTAKRLILYTLIGFVIILIARGIIQLLKPILLKEEPQTYLRNLFFCFSSVSIPWLKEKFPFLKKISKVKLKI